MINNVDFEELRDNFTTNFYQFMLSVSDGIHTDSITVCVQVMDANDNAPMFVPPSRNISVNEVRQDEIVHILCNWCTVYTEMIYSAV